MYDLVVIGGGTGGLVCAQIVAGLGARVHEMAFGAARLLAHVR